MATVISGRRFINTLCEQWGIPVERIQRIVIDAHFDDIVRVYVQSVGDDRALRDELLEIIPRPDGELSRIGVAAPMMGDTADGN